MLETHLCTNSRIGDTIMYLFKNSSGCRGTLFLITLVFVLGAPFAAGAADGKREFYNDSNETLILKKGDQEWKIRNKESLRIPVSLGDRFDVVPVKRAGQVTEHRHRPIYINHLEMSRRIVLSPRTPYIEMEQRRGQLSSGLDFEASYSGWDILKFNPMAVVKSYGRQIFEGLQPDTTTWKLEANTIIPLGFRYGGNINYFDGDEQTQEMYSYNSFMESWTAGLNVDVPIPKAKGLSAGLDFGYGESLEDTRSSNHVFIFKHHTAGIYEVSVTPEDAYLTAGFTGAVMRVNNLDDARKFVKTYGSHYAESVKYGATRSAWAAVEEEKYLEAKETNLNLAVSFKKGSDGTEKTSAVKKGDITTTKKSGSAAPKTDASGKIGFQRNTKNREEEILSDSKNRFHAYGGKGRLVGGALDVDDGNAVAVRADLKTIHNLITPQVFKNEKTEEDLGPKRDLIKQAVEEHLEKVRFLPEKKNVRGFRYRIQKIEFETDVDDASHEFKGELSAQFTMDGQSERFVLWTTKDQWNSKARREFTMPMGKWQIIEQAPHTSDSFSPIQLDLVGQIIDNDGEINVDCPTPGAWCDDPIKLLPNQSQRIDEIKGVTDFDFKMEHFASYAERMTLNVKVRVMPLPRPGNRLANSKVYR